MIELEGLGLFGVDADVPQGLLRHVVADPADDPAAGGFVEQLQAQLVAIVAVDQQLEVLRGGEVAVGKIAAAHQFGEVAVATLARVRFIRQGGRGRAGDQQAQACQVQVPHDCPLRVRVSTWSFISMRASTWRS